MIENRTVQINIRLSEDELYQIKYNANLLDKTVSAYIRETALNMNIVELNHGCVEEHTRQIVSYKNAIVSLIFTIKKMGEYTPADLEYIVSYTNELLKSEKEFLKIYSKAVEVKNGNSVHKFEKE